MDKPIFDSQITVLTTIINKRRGSWTLSTVEFDDLRQELLLRMFEKWDLFDPTKAPLEHWANKLITHFMLNTLRDNLWKFSKPCLRCIYNLDGTHCGYTKSHEQCGECPVYKKWQQKKEIEYNINASLPLENHSQEVNSKATDDIDIIKAKKIIDKKIKEKLTSRERKIYKLLYINYLTPSEAVASLKKNQKKSYKPESYSKILELQKKFIKLGKEVISKEDVY